VLFPLPSSPPILTFLILLFVLSPIGGRCVLHFLFLPFLVYSASPKPVSLNTSFFPPARFLLGCLPFPSSRQTAAIVVYLFFWAIFSFSPLFWFFCYYPIRSIPSSGFSISCFFLFEFFFPLPTPSLFLEIFPICPVFPLYKARDTGTFRYDAPWLPPFVAFTSFLL